MSNRVKAYLALLTTALIWGAAPPVIKQTLNYLSPIEFLFWRFLFVSILVLPFFLKKTKSKPFLKKDLPKALLVAFLSTSVTLGLLFLGLNQTTAVDAAVLAAITPLMIVLGGGLFLKEVITNQEKLGLFLAFLGTFVAIISPLINGQTAFSSANLVGNALIFLSNFTWASYTLIGKNLAKKYPSFNITALGFIVGLATFLPLFIVEKIIAPGAILPPLASLPGLVYMSTLGSLVAYFTYAYGMSLIEASEGTLFTYLQPVFTVPIAVFWLKESVSPAFAWGAILIVLGVVLTEYRSNKQAVNGKR